jgi:hypothetical protein
MSILLVGFEPTIAAFEQAKTVRTLDRAATVIVAIAARMKASRGTLCIMRDIQYINA